LAPQLLGDRETEAQVAAQSIAHKAGLRRQVGLFGKDIESGGQIAVKEARLGETQLRL